MYTSAVLSLVSFFVAPSPESASPTWLGDYALALRKGQQEQKPLAVFVGAGQAGFNKTSKEGKLNPAIQKILAQKYVCVYLDTTQQQGKRLVQDFEISRGRGLVISDKAGRLQAFHWDGELTQKDLERNLVRFSNPALVVQATESNTQVRTSFYPPEQSYTPAPVYSRGC